MVCGELQPPVHRSGPLLGRRGLPCPGAAGLPPSPRAQRRRVGSRQSRWPQRLCSRRLDRCESRLLRAWSERGLRQLRGKNGCQSPDSRRPGCREMPLVDEALLAAGPDARSVYLLSGGVSSGSRVRLFQRAPGSGALRRFGGRAGCVGDWVTGCRLTTDSPTSRLAVEPDGRSAYLLGQGSLLVLDRARRGQLSQRWASGPASADSKAGRVRSHVRSAHPQTSRSAPTVDTSTSHRRTAPLRSFVGSRQVRARALRRLGELRRSSVLERFHQVPQRLPPIRRPRGGASPCLAALRPAGVRSRSGSSSPRASP